MSFSLRVHIGPEVHELRLLRLRDTFKPLISDVVGKVGAVQVLSGRERGRTW